MHRTAVSFLLSLAFLLSMMAAPQVVMEAEANPFPWNSEITIESPTNKTYNVDSLVLNVTIATKFDGTYTSSSRRAVNYSLDSQPDVPLEAVNFYYDNESQSSIFVGSTLLEGITEGSHSLKVQCRYFYEVEVNAGGNTYITQSHYSVEYVNFTVDTKSIQAEGYNITVEVSSPIPDKTYKTNNVPLSFSCDANINNSSNVASYSVVFDYNLDGQPGFDMFGNPVFSGETKRIGQFYQPVPIDYNSSIHVPDGIHSLFVLVTFWITPTGEHQNTFSARAVSQVVNFTISAGTTNSSDSLTSTDEPFPWVPVSSAVAVVAVVVAVAAVVYLKKRKR